jgi:hypothetical protein
MGAAIALATSIAWPQTADPPRPRDAAEAVREGDVSQWLKYYERERAEEWQRALPEQRAEKGSCVPSQQTGGRPSPGPER